MPARAAARGPHCGCVQLEEHAWHVQQRGGLAAAAGGGRRAVRCRLRLAGAAAVGQGRRAALPPGAPALMSYSPTGLQKRPERRDLRRVRWPAVQTLALLCAPQLLFPPTLHPACIDPAPSGSIQHHQGALPPAPQPLKLEPKTDLGQRCTAAAALRRAATPLMAPASCRREAAGWDSRAACALLPAASPRPCSAACVP